MALSLGTNCGFVTEAPASDPNGGSSSNITRTSVVARDTSPATAAKITEIGWYCNNATQEANFEVGLYTADGAVVPGEAGTRLYVDATNAKGTTAGWKKVTVDWDIEPNTVYWLAFQLDTTATASYTDIETTGGMTDYIWSSDTLPNPFGGGAIYSNYISAIYAVWEAGEAPSGTNQWINVDDAWRQLSEAWVNVDDAWRKVKEAWINIDDAWRKLYSV